MMLKILETTSGSSLFTGGRAEPFQVMRRLGVTIASVALAAAVRLLLDPFLEHHYAYTFFYTAIALTAWYAGFWPSLAAIVLSYLSAEWLFIPPVHRLDFINFDIEDLFGLMGFLASGLAIALTSNALRVAKQRAEQSRLELAEAEAQLRRHADELEARVEERTANLRETVESLEGVCYHLAHDLRAPLRAMSGFTQLLLLEYGQKLDDDGREYARRISGAAAHMDVLLTSLLSYGGLGHRDFPLHQIDLAAEMEQVLSQLADDIARGRARVEVQSPLPKVWGNSVLVQQIFTNLVSNALKFIPAGVEPRVRIFAYVCDQTVRVWVEDNGIGIPDDFRNKVFKIFEKFHGPDVYPGTGIGLAIVAKAAQRMQGRAGFESESGHGSRFWIELPLAVDTAGRTIAAPA